MTTRSRSLLAGVVLPLLMLGGAFALLASWVPRLPQRVVLHWGVDGPDRFGTPTQLFAPYGIVTIALCVPMIIAVIVVRGASRRLLVGVAAGVTALMVGLLIGIAAVQVDTTSGQAIGTPGPQIAIACLAAVVVGLAAALLAGADPRQPDPNDVPADAARVSLPAGASAVWSRPLRSMPPAATIGLVGLLVALAVTSALLTRSWWVAAVTLSVLVVVVLTTGWQVSVDRKGLLVRSYFGWPRTLIPADEVIRADVVMVRPLSEFGGWGYRIGRDGAIGFIGRKGEAIAVERTGHRRVIVTVDDAQRGAALLNTVAEAARSSSAG